MTVIERYWDDACVGDEGRMRDVRPDDVFRAEQGAGRSPITPA